MNAPTNNNFHINKNGRVAMFCILQTVFTNEKNTRYVPFGTYRGFLYIICFQLNQKSIISSSSRATITSSVSSFSTISASELLSS
jgi:hypothetical protein